VVSGCLARADGTPIPPDAVNLSIEATVKFVSDTPTTAPPGVCTLFDRGSSFAQFTVREASGVDFILSATDSAGLRAILAPEAAVRIGLRTGTPFGFTAHPALVTIHRGQQLEWFAMSGGYMSSLFSVPGFDVVFGVEPLACSECVGFDLPSLATLGSDTIRDACGDRLGDFLIRQSYRGAGRGGQCDIPGAYRSSAIRVH
jgi:hypothetical protein